MADTYASHDPATTTHAHVNLPAGGHVHPRADGQNYTPSGDHEHISKSGLVVRWDVTETPCAICADRAHNTDDHVALYERQRRETEERIKAAIDLAEETAREAIGNALVSVFPEATTGDESPDTVFALAAEIESTVRAWVENNVVRMREDAAEEAADREQGAYERAHGDAPTLDRNKGWDANALEAAREAGLVATGWDKAQTSTDDDPEMDEKGRAEIASKGWSAYLANGHQDWCAKMGDGPDTDRDNVCNCSPRPTVALTLPNGERVMCAECGLPVSMIVATRANGMTSRYFCDGPDNYPDHVPAPAFYPGRETPRSLAAKLRAEPQQDVPILLGAPDGWYSYIGEYHRGPTIEEAATGQGNEYALPTIDVGESWDARDL